VDIDEDTYNMDPQKLREYLEVACSTDDHRQTTDRATGKRVAAIVPVHLYGQMCDMDPILELAERHGLMVIEDACQAHGAEYFSTRENRWRKAGSMGRAAAFSFYPGKNLGACGEAGAVTTDDAKLAQKTRMLRDHGQGKKYYHEMEGYNGRLDAIQAGILQVKLQHLPAWTEERRECAIRYQELLSSTEGVLLPAQPAWSRAVYHLYVIRVEDRGRLQQDLAATNIGTAIHYPVPLHLQEAYAKMGYQSGDFPVAERCAEEILSLPMFPGLSAEQQKRIAKDVQASVRCVSTPELAGATANARD
jgi:dTDP-4-amino-4,6-dideoxygalactose transaminase